MIFACGEGKYKVTMEVIRHDEGLTAILTGGEKPHVGAAVLAVPRDSLSGEGSACDCYVVPVPGHKDDIVAKQAAAGLCMALKEPVCVSAGVHVDHASEEEIRQLCANCEDVTATAVRMIRKMK